jgi:hypothetical protein
MLLSWFSYGWSRNHSSTIPSIQDSFSAHVSAFELMFYVSAGIALVGALVCLVLVRRGDRLAEGPVCSRRSRWQYVTTRHRPGVTKRPPPSSRSHL